MSVLTFRIDLKRVGGSQVGFAAFEKEIRYSKIFEIRKKWENIEKKSMEISKIVERDFGEISKIFEYPKSCRKRFWGNFR